MLTLAGDLWKLIGKKYVVMTLNIDQCPLVVWVVTIACLQLLISQEIVKQFVRYQQQWQHLSYRPCACCL